MDECSTEDKKECQDKTKGSHAGATPYDDVFRTLVTECRELVLPLLNEVFGEHYTGEERIEFRQNEHFLRQQDGQEQRKVTDSSFRVIGEEGAKSYLLECQSTADSSMLVRIFEYVTQVALDEGVKEEDRLIVEIPHAAILFLRSTRNTPDIMTIELHTLGGDMSFTIPTIKVKSYDVDMIFEKKLYFLIPFYIFNYESRFKKIDANPAELESMMDEYGTILESLESVMKEGAVTAFTEKTLVEMSEKVLEALADKYGNIKEGVRKIMGGRVIEHEAKRIFDEGRAEGIEVGIEKGMEKGEMSKAKETVLNLYKMKMNDSFISQAVGIPIETVQGWITAACLG